MKDYLKNRRSTKLKYMTDPAPSAEELEAILNIAARVPDHGKLSPFYFIVFEGGTRVEFGQHLRDVWAKNHPESTDKYLKEEASRFTRAPMVIAVISRIREAKIPIWEQLMTAGACCYNLCLAANSHGYGANWLTEWYAYDEDIRGVLGLENGRDNVAGFIYIGTETEKQDDRDRPDLENITNYWTSHKPSDKKGDNYNKDGLGMPNHGFEITQSTIKK